MGHPGEEVTHLLLQQKISLSLRLADRVSDVVNYNTTVNTLSTRFCKISFIVKLSYKLNRKSDCIKHLIQMRLNKKLDDRAIGLSPKYYTNRRGNPCGCPNCSNVFCGCFTQGRHKACPYKNRNPDIKQRSVPQAHNIESPTMCRTKSLINQNLDAFILRVAFGGERSGNRLIAATNHHYVLRHGHAAQL